MKLAFAKILSDSEASREMICIECGSQASGQTLPQRHSRFDSMSNRSPLRALAKLVRRKGRIGSASEFPEEYPHFNIS